MTERRRPHRYLWALYDREGRWAGMYESAEEAHDDAAGPRFRGYTVRKYRLLLRREEDA